MVTTQTNSESLYESYLGFMNLSLSEHDNGLTYFNYKGTNEYYFATLYNALTYLNNGDISLVLAKFEYVAEDVECSESDKWFDANVKSYAKSKTDFTKVTNIDGSVKLSMIHLSKDTRIAITKKCETDKFCGAALNVSYEDNSVKFTFEDAEALLSGAIIPDLHNILISAGKQGIKTVTFTTDIGGILVEQLSTYEV